MQYNMATKLLGGVSKFSTDGGTLTTELYLSGDPVNSMEAASKRYVDSKISAIAGTSVVSGTMPIGRFPAYTGDITNTAGSNVLTLKNSGVTAGTYPKVTATTKGLITQGMSLSADDIPNLTWGKVSLDRPTTLSGFGISDALTKSGGGMTGFISVMNAPTQTLHAANKSYVDSYSVSSGNSLTAGTIVRLPQTVTPVGYLRCNGALVGKTTYPTLYTFFGDNVVSQITTTPGAGKPWRQQYEFNTTQTANVSSWTAHTRMPEGISFFGVPPVWVTKNRVYTAGGTSLFSSDRCLYSAVINSTGDIGGWVQSGVLPSTVNVAGSVVVTKSRVYLLGGWESATSSHAAINSDGTLGAWDSGTPLALGCNGGDAFVVKDRVYLLGGFADQQNSGQIQSAVFDSNGVLGPWAVVGSLPQPVSSAAVAVTRNRVYVIGGYTGDAVAVTSVYTAAINSDGSLGTWTTGPSIPYALYSPTATVVKNKIYLSGGGNNGNPQNNTYTASINADGTIGGWVAGVSLSKAVYECTSFVTNSRLYVIGSNLVADAPSLSVWVENYYQSTSFSGGLNDYSTYYTTGYTATDPDNFQLPDYTSLETADFKYYIKY